MREKAIEAFVESSRALYGEDGKVNTDRDPFELMRVMEEFHTAWKLAENEVSIFISLFNAPIIKFEEYENHNKNIKNL